METCYPSVPEVVDPDILYGRLYWCDWVGWLFPVDLREFKLTFYSTFSKTRFTFRPCGRRSRITIQTKCLLLFLQISIRRSLCFFGIDLKMQFPPLTYMSMVSPNRISEPFIVTKSQNSRKQQLTTLRAPGEPCAAHMQGFHIYFTVNFSVLTTTSLYY